MAGKATVNQLQLGDSATATQNFVLQTNVDGSAKLARGNAGATTQDVLTVDSSGVVTATQGLVTNRMVLSTAQNTTSGTVIDFTGIPSWAKRVTVMFNGVSTSGTSIVLVQLGSGSVTASGYTGSHALTSQGSSGIAGTSSAGIPTYYQSAADVRYGSIVFTHLGSNLWVATGVINNFATNVTTCCGSVTLSGTLDRLRLTTVNGTDTFDAGSVNIMYEG